MRLHCVPSCFLLWILVASQPVIASPGAQDAERAPLFDNLGKHRRAVSTKSVEAQRYFDQGLTLAFAFNHDEAIRSFREAARIDPRLAMAWWGVALCNGPHINNPVLPPARAEAAWEALQKAESLAGGATAVEQALIRALGKRYADATPGDRPALDRAYADAMRSVAQSFPEDADVAVLFAESMMDLRPWDLWAKDGKPHAGTEEILATLERAMKLNANHPGALHLYIHAVEASPEPARAIEAADRLRHLVPGAGHLVHMPSHIDVLVGRWQEAIEANYRAIAADRAYRARSPRQGFFRVYMAHNQHMLAFAAMMDGQSAVALKAAREMISDIPDDFANQNVMLVDGLLPMPSEVLMRFGRWEELLQEPKPAAKFPVATAFYHYARGAALAATGKLSDAEAELEAFDRAAAAVPPESIITLNPARSVLAIARNVLAGEIAFHRGRGDEAVEKLRDAVAQEDNLTYIEPPDWIQPARHALGAVLVELGRGRDAEAVYREDLRRHPDNGWSLYGLSRALRLRGANEEAEKMLARFRAAWQRADVDIQSSCACTQVRKAD